VSSSGLGGRTLAVFANIDGAIADWLPIAIPGDDRTGSAYASWGALDVAPLWFLDSVRERVIALYADRDHWRLFDVWLDDVVEIDTRVRDMEDDDAPRPAKQEHPAYLASRGGSTVDDEHRHLDELAQRFHREAAERLTLYVANTSAEIVLMGPAASVADVDRQLGDSTRDRIAARLPGLSRPDAPATELHERLRPTLQALADERHRSLLEKVQVGGILGLVETLTAMQSGRLSSVVARWPLPRYIVHEHMSSGYVSATPEGARIGAGPIRHLELAAALGRLSRQHGTTLEFVTGGDAARVLAEQRGPIAGIPRW
jgi:hypothetical protein